MPRLVVREDPLLLVRHDTTRLQAGHALMSHLVGDLLPVHKVTIVSRGQALGYTLNLPMEERYLHTKEELIDMVTPPV